MTDAEGTATQADSRGAKSAADRVVSPYLFVALHCDLPALGGARYALDGVEEVVLMRGREREATRHDTADGRTLDLRLPGSFMSRVHARLKRVQGQWLVVDEGTTNGSFVNGKRITKALLADRDVLECGHTLLVFRAGLSRPRDVPADRDDGDGPANPLATLLPELEGRHVLLARVARSPLSVLLLGDSGTGKEIAARALHALSGREGAFVPVNCGALPEGLLEAQLFGHTKGAFSGATKDEPGFFRAASGGTLFLDELGDLPHASQTAFLRATEEGVITPVGSTRALPVDVRIVAATNRPLAELVTQGAFREDLLARLSGFTHRLMPLCDRIEDMGLLVAALLAGIAGPRAADVAIEVDAGLELLAHDWPLNVRELRNALASAVVLAAGAPLGRAHFAASIGRASATMLASSDPPAELEARLVAELERHGGNVAAVARALGKAPTQIHRWMRRYKLDPGRFRT